MSDADRAYAEAERLIAEAKANGPKVLDVGNGGVLSIDGKALLVSGFQKRLDLSGPLFSVLSSLPPQIAEVAHLEHLYLSGTQVSDLGPLSGLTSLTGLWLNGTQVSDVTALSGLTSLTDLWLEGTEVSDLRPLRGLRQLVEAPEIRGLTFKGCAAARADARIAEIAEIEDDAERARVLFDYLEDWVPPPRQGASEQPDVPSGRPAPLRTGFADGRMVRLPLANLPGEEVLHRAAQGWEALRAYRSVFGDSFNVHNYAPLPSYLDAFDRAMGAEFDPQSMIMIGVMGQRLVRLSKNSEFLASLPVGADSDLQGFGAEILLYLQRFQDWTDYVNDADGRVASLKELQGEADVFDDLLKTMKDTPEIDAAVTDEYQAELEETRRDGADDIVARAFDRSNTELIRTMAEKAVDEVKSGRLVRQAVDDMDKVADTEFAKVQFYTYGWTLVVLKRNQAPLRKLSKRQAWIDPVLDYLVGPEGE